MVLDFLKLKAGKKIKLPFHAFFIHFKDYFSLKYKIKILQNQNFFFWSRRTIKITELTDIKCLSGLRLGWTRKYAWASNLCKNLTWQSEMTRLDFSSSGCLHVCENVSERVCVYMTVCVCVCKGACVLKSFEKGKRICHRGRAIRAESVKYFLNKFILLKSSNQLSDQFKV